MNRRFIYPLLAIGIAVALILHQELTSKPAPTPAPATPPTPMVDPTPPPTRIEPPVMRPLETPTPAAPEAPSEATPTAKPPTTPPAPTSQSWIPRRNVPAVAKAKGTILDLLCQDLGISVESDDAAELYAWVMHRAQRMEEAAGPVEIPHIANEAARRAYNDTQRAFRDHLVTRFGRSATDKVLARVPLELLGAEGWPAARLTASSEVDIPVRRGEREEDP